MNALLNTVLAQYLPPNRGIIVNAVRHVVELTWSSSKTRDEMDPGSGNGRIRRTQVPLLLFNHLRIDFRAAHVVSTQSVQTLPERASVRKA